MTEEIRTDRKPIIKFVFYSIVAICTLALVVLQFFSVFNVYSSFERDIEATKELVLQYEKEKLKNEISEFYKLHIKDKNILEAKDIDKISNRASKLADKITLDTQNPKNSIQNLKLDENEHIFLYKNSGDVILGSIRDSEVKERLFANYLQNSSDTLQVGGCFFVLKPLKDTDAIMVYKIGGEKFSNTIKDKLLSYVKDYDKKNLFLLDTKNSRLVFSHKIAKPDHSFSDLGGPLHDAYSKSVRIAKSDQKEGLYMQEYSRTETRFMTYSKDIGFGFVIGASTNLEEVQAIVNEKKDRRYLAFLKEISVSIIALFGCIILASLCAFFIKQKIGNHFHNFLKDLENTSKGTKYLSNENIEFTEFTILTQNVNALIKSMRLSNFRAKESARALASYTNAIDEIALVFKINKKNQITYANKTACDLLQYQKHEILNALSNSELIEQFKSSRDLGGDSWHGVLQIPRKDGSICYAKASKIPYFDDKETVSEYLVVCSDITAFVTQDKIIQEHLNDPLTNLQNRQSLMRKLQQDDKYAFIANLDILRFKQINEYYGFNIGDKVLLAVSDRLDSLLEDKNLELFKLTNDSFAITGLKIHWTMSKFKDFCHYVVDYFEDNPIIIDDNKFNISLVFGISSDVKQSITSEIAKDYAKSSKQSIVVFDDQKESLLNTINLTQSLKKAIEDNRIILYKQGIVDNQSQQTVKYECLVRMIDENNKIVPPIEFLKIAKRSNLYQELTKIVIDTAFKYFKDNEFEFSINLAIDDILSNKVVSFLEQNLIKYPNIGKRLTLEILEDESINNFEKVNKFISKMRQYGCKIAIDDFGTGYANFEHLLRIKADFIKIDGSMIKNIDKNEDSRRIVELMVNFSKSLNIKTVAEFVHSSDVLQKVKDIGIDASQGYYFDEPKPILS